MYSRSYNIPALTTVALFAAACNPAEPPPFEPSPSAVETEPVQTEPVQTEPVESEPQETEPGTEVPPIFDARGSWGAVEQRINDGGRWETVAWPITIEYSNDSETVRQKSGLRLELSVFSEGLMWSYNETGRYLDDELVREYTSTYELDIEWFATGARTFEITFLDPSRGEPRSAACKASDAQEDDFTSCVFVFDDSETDIDMEFDFRR